ncbi:hypothetical protein SCHPADRAFT_927143 [Schizopora paradoxa]|uniref:DNA-directed RNA polymerases I and III subunit RPAC1 n=1 Tax=Schizopora paradoxa TaxID=27342 RepID=A0A0H2S1C7_9AGAM|nr:hypothetical protein SCHPADRAFT_927143 [Schizopora paradoxa]
MADINPRRLVRVHPERVTDVSSTDFPGHYPGEDHSWDHKLFKKNLKLSVKRLSQRSIEFDLVGVDASIANAFRRIMIAEVPTICIEEVYVWNNTSVIQDEVVAQRLGLIPLNVDPDLFETRGVNDSATDRNTLVFKLNVACTKKPNVPAGTIDAEKLYENSTVTAGHLEWVPQGEQEELQAFKIKPPASTNPNIVIAKLRPGQEMEMELHCIKNVGKEHAKWSPVATASYRLLPHITLYPKTSFNTQLKRIPPEHADKFASCFSPGVIRVDPVTKAVSVDPKGVRGETMSREVFRHPEFTDCFGLGRVRDWFMFTVESEGPYAPEDIFPASIRVMRSKIANLKKATERLMGMTESDEPQQDTTEDVQMADT